MNQPIVLDNPVYQESYYQDVTLIWADGAGCSTPELVFVSVAPGEWEGVGYDLPSSDAIPDPWIGVAE